MPALTTYTTKIQPEWVDYNGHLRDAFYLLIFSYATDALMDTLGLDSENREASGHSLFTLELHLNYLHEVKLGAEVSEFQSVAEATGLDLRARIGDFAVLTDLRLMTRILRNFLSNACRYTERGSILLGARRRGAMLRLEVWDTGRGIAADRLDSIFLEFNQLDVGRAADRKGVGLGLAIVERIAKILGYPVLVRSQIGRAHV